MKKGPYSSVADYAKIIMGLVGIDSKKVKHSIIS